MTVAVRVHDLGKRYRIGVRDHRYKTLRDSIADAVVAPFRNLKRLRSLTHFKNGDDDQADDVIWALREINFEVERGEVVGIIGANGAGKSTLLKILSRITEPTTGFVEIYGRVSSLLEVGTGFHPELTGRENVYLNGTVLGMRKNEIVRKFDEIVDFSGVEKFIDTPVKRYSIGMQVRLAFAVAAHLEPEILIIDEVLAVGDAAFKRKCFGKMEKVAREGRTVLFVSHQMSAVSNLCDRCVLLENGRVAEIGPTEKVTRSYLSAVEEHEPPSLQQLNRTGNGRVRFLDTWVENERDERVVLVRSGDDLKIVAEYEALDSSVRDLTVTFAVSDVEGTPLTDLSSTCSKKGLYDGRLPAKGRIVCYLPRLPLNIGTYFFNIIARSGGATEDWIINAGKFRVEEGDFFGTGGTVDTNQGMVLLNQEWTLQES